MQGLKQFLSFATAAASVTLLPSHHSNYFKLEGACARGGLRLCDGGSDTTAVMIRCLIDWSDVCAALFAGAAELLWCVSSKRESERAR
jgi:hypothetical protein